MDDLLLIGADINEINKLKLALHDKSSMTDLGPIAYYLEEGIKLFGQWDGTQKILSFLCVPQNDCKSQDTYLLQD